MTTNLNQTERSKLELEATNGIQIEKADAQIKRNAKIVSNKLKNFAKCGGRILASGVLGVAGAVVLDTPVNIAAPVIAVAFSSFEVKKAKALYNEMIDYGKKVRANIHKVVSLEAELAKAGVNFTKRRNPNGIEKFSAIMSMMDPIKIKE